MEINLAHWSELLIQLIHWLVSVHDLHMEKQKPKYKNLGQERIPKVHFSSLGKISCNAKKKLWFYTLPEFILFQVISIYYNI